MKLRIKQIYAAVGIIFALSALLYFFLPDTTFFQTLTAIPMVGSLLATLFVLLRDYMAHERAQQLIDTKNNFLVGASSHMANVAFDKHVEFAEEYVAEAQEALRTLFREGPTRDALPHAAKLYSIQEKYVVWLTVALEADLEKFEAALRKIGASAGLASETRGEPNYQKTVAAMYKTFADVLGQERMGSDEWEGEKLSEDRAVSMLIQRLRTILGTEELTTLRRRIIAKAVG